MADDKWEKLDAPPPPMFLGEKERNLVKQVNDDSIFYEIVKTNEPKHLFGQADTQFEIIADCIRARDGVFNAE